MLKKGSGNQSIQFGNNNSEINVIISDNEMMREMQELIMQLSSDIVWAEQQLKAKDIIIEELLKRLKR